MAPLESAYYGKSATLPTLHGKESVISPIFQSALGLSVQVSKIDTDQFGTFSGEIPRTLSQLDAAVAKARAAISLTGMPLAIASEGTIGPNPLIPIASSDLETLVFIDSERDLIIHESFRSSEIVTARIAMEPGEDLDKFLAKADFPNHGLIVRSESPAPVQALKGIQDFGKLVQAIQNLARESGSVIVESDLRANFSPSRMKNIAECARLLTARIASTCPKCSTAGWGTVAPIFGLPCGDCGELVESAVAADQLGCVQCEHRQIVPRLTEVAEARFCSACNP
jgi:hypothetical protein